MAWDDAAKKVAIKVIGTVESNMKYDSIYYVDPITVGIMQWYGTRAANVLNEMRATPAWVGVAASLTNDLIAQPETKASFWTERRLVKNEGESLKPVLRSTTGVQIQNAKIITDLEDYRVAGAKLDLDAETNTNSFIYWCVMYHQSPRYAREILRVAGESPTIERLHSLTLNHSWYKGFKNRYNQAKALIMEGDSTGVPDIEQPGDPAPDPDSTTDDIDPGDAGSQATGDLRSITLVGGALHVHYKSGATVIAQPTPTGTTWLPGVTTLPDTGPPVVAPTPPVVNPGTPPVLPDPSDPPSTVPLDVQAKRNGVVKWMADREKRFNYSQSGNRNNPDVSGYGDCSSTVRRAYKDVCGIEVGSYTVDQQNYGKVIFDSRKSGKNTKPSTSILEKGDLIFFCYRSSFTRVQHVEMWMGTRHMGHGGPNWGDKGPVYKSSTWWNKAPWIIVRRHLG